ncbi:MAG: NAD(P)-dependent oxidoreductase [Gemmatimonadetes bacterium]|nr:NAD(P)-dependent oxidoreductase [Gemmatimonadota bacterium]
MRVLVTGGTGFIGSALARRLLQRGDEVRLLSLVATPAEAANATELESRGVEVVRGSVAERALHARALRGVDAVHHVAATMREADVPDRVFWDTNLAATQDLLRASREAGVARFVYCSTMGVTGDIRGRVVDETAPYRPRDIYTNTKAAAERWVLEEARTTGYAATAVRPADVYGPGDRRLQKLFRMVQKGSFVYLGDGRGRRHMVYIDDLLDGMLAAQESPVAPGEAFLLAGPRALPLREIVERIALALGVSAPTRRLPYRPVRWASALVEAVCRPLRVQPPIYPRRVDFYAHDYAFDIGKARRLLGWEPRVDVDEGVRRTIDAYREEGVLT